MVRIIYVDDDQVDEEGNPLMQDITETVNELAEENEQFAQYFEEVTAGFEEESGIELSQQAEELLLARGANPNGSGTASTKLRQGKPSAGASAGSAKLGKGRASSAAGSKGSTKPFIGKSTTVAGAAKKIGKHVVHAAKVVGKFAGKHPTALAAAGGAAAGAYVANRVNGVKASQDDLELGLFAASKMHAEGTRKSIARAVTGGMTGEHMRNQHNKGLVHGMKANSKGIRKLGHYAAAAAGDAGHAGIGGVMALRQIRKNNAAGMYKNRIAASHDEHLVLDENEYEVEDVEDTDLLTEEVEYTQEELDAMTPEQAAELLEAVTEDMSEEELQELEAIAAEEERQESLREFASTVLEKDAEARNPSTQQK